MNEIIENLKIEKPEVDTSPREEFQAKLDFMVADLEKRGVDPKITMPLFCRWAWSIHWQVVPPLFADFWQLAACLGTVYGASWAIVMLILHSGDVSSLFEQGYTMGLFYGLGTAGYLRVRRGKLGLPHWGDYARSETTQSSQSE